MGQAANNRGRNASLDEKKQRAAGRGMAEGAAPDFNDPPGRGQTLGAFGNDANAPAKPPAKKQAKRGAAKKSKR